jgi:choloylglycine hydrolase
MIRKVAVATLIAAFISATTPGFACSGISLMAKDGAAIRGRTLEFGFPMQSNVIVIPAGKEMSGTLPDGGKGLTYISRYAIVGASALGLPAILDGIHDQGLSVGLFYFPNYAKYTDVTPENAKHAIAPQEFGMWVLANFATVDEVKEGVKSIVVVPTPAPGLGSPQGIVAGAHFFIQDKSGKSIAIEPVDGTLKVHDAPLGIMTNAPTYDWHMTNLQNYINLSVKDVESAKLGPVTLPAIGSGTGLNGMPGDFTPPSRNPSPIHRRISSPEVGAEIAIGQRAQALLADCLSQTQNLRADHPPAAEEAALPIAPWIERCLPGRGIARHDIANVGGGVPNALNWPAHPDGVRRLARACEQKPDRQS